MVKRVGFIGLGIMGRPMAKNLLKAGFSLVVVGGRARAAVEELKPMGVKVVDSPREVAEEVDIVVTCLPESKDVEEVCLGANGVIEAAREGLAVIDMSTISPAVTRRIADELKGRGAEMLDAPVSGGQKGAVEGSLSVMVGGEASTVERCMDVFRALGRTIVHVGGNGAGQYTKAANQIICAVTWQAIGEGMALGVKAGVNPERMLEALKGGAARCWALENRVPLLLEGNYEPGFMAKLQHKDLVIASEAGREMGVPLPVTAIVKELYRAVVNKGRGERDTSVLVTLVEDLSGARIRK